MERTDRDDAEKGKEPALTTSRVRRYTRLY